MNILMVIGLILAVRLGSVFVVQTYYVPDEYWQSLEVAHKLAFGYGYLTWEWVHGIRSYAYPLMIAALYKILAVLNMDTVQMLTILPRIFQALLSAYADYRFYIWSGKMKWSLYMILTSFFWFYTCSRTLTNTLEASLSTIALSFFPWYGGNGSAYLVLAAICCYLRPTATLIWIPLCIYHLNITKQLKIREVLERFVVIGFVVALIFIGIDSRIHGSWLITPLEFFTYNIYHNIGTHYGSHAWYWYFVIGLPTVLGVNFVPFLISLVDTARNRSNFRIRKVLSITILINLAALSLIAHKEFRFLLALLPMCLYLIADSLRRWSYNASSFAVWLVTTVIFVSNAMPGMYLSRFHLKGTLDLMPKLQYIAQNYRDEFQNRASITFLLPCHTTPYYSHIHENITMRFLTCEPNFSNRRGYRDEAEIFFHIPSQWIATHITKHSHDVRTMPSHIVIYEPFILGSPLEKYYDPVEIVENMEMRERISPKVLFEEWMDKSNKIESRADKFDVLIDVFKEKTVQKFVILERRASSNIKIENEPKVAASIPKNKPNADLFEEIVSD